MPGATALFAHHSPSATRLIKLQHFCSSNHSRLPYYSTTPTTDKIQSRPTTTTTQQLAFIASIFLSGPRLMTHLVHPPLLIPAHTSVCN